MMPPLQQLLSFHPILATALLPIFFSFFFLLLQWKAQQLKNDKKLNLPPSPPRLPLVGNLHQLGSLPHRSLRDLSKRHGPLMLLRLGNIPAVVVSSSELAREVMKTQDLAFASRPQMSMLMLFTYGGKDVGLAPYGEHWRQMRRVCVLQLLSPIRVQSFSQVRTDEVRLMLRKISSHGGRRPVNFTDITVALANNIVCRAAFGRTFFNDDDEAGDGNYHRVQGMIGELMVLLGSFPLGDYMPWLSWVDAATGLNARAKKAFNDLDAFLDSVIDDRLRSSARSLESSTSSSSSTGSSISSSFVDVLLSLNIDDTDGMTLDRDCIKATILDMFTGGTETSSLVITWTMAELMRHPAELFKAQEEVRRIFGSSNNSSNNNIVDDEGLSKLSYLKAVIKESMRLHTPFPFLLPRESTKDAVLGGYHIPAKTMVMVNAWAIARDPGAWEDPEEFRPERFVGSDVDFRGQDFQYTPFGSGRRGCPGIHFAMSTIELAIASLLYHFHWELPDGKKPMELLVNEAPGLSAKMKSSLILVVTAHNA